MSEPTRAGVSLKFQTKLDGDFSLLTTGVWIEESAWAEKGETANQLIDRIAALVEKKLDEIATHAIKELN